MSGYNPETGIFGLTWTKASFWFRRESEDIPANCRALKDTGKMEFFACFLRHHGLEVLHVDRAYLNVRATPGKLWEVLSGQPSDYED
jgi:hypothetical protein